MPSIKELVVGLWTLLVFSVCVASSAQATWLVRGTSLTGTQSVNTENATTTDVNYKLVFSLIEIECTGLKGTGGKISASNKASATSLEFVGCKVTTPASCTLEGTKIGTLPVEGEPTLGTNGKETHGKTKPTNTNKEFATFKLNGEKCSAEGKEGVTGEAEVKGADGQETKTSHVAAGHANTSELKVGSAAATISGEVTVTLEGEPVFAFM
jgi:hypothetical protein